MQQKIKYSLMLINNKYTYFIDFSFYSILLHNIDIFLISTDRKQVRQLYFKDNINNC